MGKNILINWNRESSRCCYPNRLQIDVDKIDFKLKLIRRHKEVHFFLIKGIINKGNITIQNIYTKCWVTKIYLKCTTGFKDAY